METVNKQEIIIDLRRNTTVSFPYFTQFDTNTLDFIVKENGVDANLTDVTEIVVNFKRSDKQTIIRSLTAVGNVVTYTLGTEEMQTTGYAEISISFFEGQNRLSTRKMKLYIGESLGPAFEKSEGMPLLQELFVEVAENVQLINATNLDINTQEDTRQVNEQTRQTQEQTRQTNTTDAIGRLDTAVDDLKLNWHTPVNTFADLATTYPVAEKGYTSMVRDTGKVYRHNGTEWREIQDIDPAAINEVDNRLSKQLADTVKKLTVSSTPPANPRLHDVWIDISYTPIDSISPQDNSFLPKDGVVKMVFNKWLDETETLIGKVSVYPTDADRSAGTNAISGTITRVSNKILTFKPTTNLTPGVYYVRVSEELPFADGTLLSVPADLDFTAIEFVNAAFDTWDAINLTPTGWAKTLSGTSTESVLEITDDAARGKVLRMKSGHSTATNLVSIKQTVLKQDKAALKQVGFYAKVASGISTTAQITVSFVFLASDGVTTAFRVTCLLNGTLPADTSTNKHADLRGLSTPDTWVKHNIDIEQCFKNAALNMLGSNFYDCEIRLSLNSNSANQYLELRFDNLEFMGEV